MTCAWQSEIDPACIALLNRRFTVPLIPDCRNVTASTVEPVDLICGGFPCQDVSVAGKRAGLAGERSGLWFEFHRILSELKPAWVVVENVPGLLSSNSGRDFAVILRGLVELRYGVAWRVLDARYFGVPQRRRRVFIVGHLGDGRAAQVLFESESVSGNPATRRAPGATIAGIAAPLTASGRCTERAGESRGQDTLIAFGGNNTAGPIDVATACNAHGGSGRMDFESETFIFEPRFARNGRGGPEPIAPPLKAQSGQHKRADRPGGGMYVNETETALTVGTTDQTVIAFAWQQGVSENDRSYPVRAGDYAGAVSGTRVDAVSSSAISVRRLTPLECERLQGFPDIQNSCIIEVWENCSDLLMNSALADALSRKSPRLVSSAVNTESLPSAWSAVMSSQLRHRSDSRHVVLNVHIDCERNVLEVSNQEKLLWSVSGADEQNTSRLSMPTDDFVRLVALITSTVGIETHNGKAVSRQSTPPSIPPLSGKSVVALSGREIVQRVSGVAQNTARINSCIKYIISEAELNSPNYAQALITLCCYVSHVIVSSIPGLTLPTSSFSLSLVASSGWTSGQSDSARYRQLGNAVAVPVVEWIGRRIVNAEEQP